MSDSSKRVLLDIVLLDMTEAENIFKQLNFLYEAMKQADTTPEDRKDVVRGMVKLKVAINAAKS